MKRLYTISGFNGTVGKTVLLFVLSLLIVYRPTAAQVSTASINGTVQDSSGAIIKGAQIKITQTDTGIAHTTVSGDDGSFTVPSLPVGSYSVGVEFTGFAPYDQTGIVLTVGQVATVNISLKPGSATQTVTVQANAQIVETTESSSSSLVNEQQVVGLPLNGRNPATLVFLAGGASNPIQNIPQSNTGSAILQNSLVYPSEVAPTIHGERGGGVYFSLDGANNVDTYEITGGPFPNPDATQEFTVVSGNYGARYVSAPGGAVNIVTKSGTNDIHGDVFEFVRNGYFNARNFFSTQPDVLKRNQFGGTLGAPIVRNRWFIFGSYQGTRLTNSVNGNIAFVPTNAERGGDFSALLPGTQLKNPFTQQPIPGNNLAAAGLLDPVIQKLLQYIPTTTAANQQVVFSQPISQTENQYIIKSDYILGNHRIFSRYFHSGFEWTPNGIPGGDFLASYRGQNHTWNNVTAGDTWTRGNFVSDFRFTYVRDLSVTEAGENSVSLPSLGANFTPGQFPTIQSLSVTNGFSIIPGNYNGFPRHTIDFAEDVMILRGRHQISFGSEVQHIYTLLKTDNGQNSGGSFSGALSGNAFADFIAGATSSFSQSDGIDIAASGTLPGFYVEDRMRTTNRLTLTGGVRWDPYWPFKSQGGRIECWQPGIQSKVFINAPAGLTFPGDPGCNTSGTETTLGDVQPRVGFAYQLDSTGKTALRGGYGIYTSQFPMASFLAFGTIQPFLRSISISNPGPISNPWVNFPGGNPFANGFELNLGARAANTPFVNPGTAYTFNPGFKLSYTQQWSLILERALAANDAITISYFGSKGTHLSMVQDDNEAVFIPGIVQPAGTAGASCVVGQYGNAQAQLGQPCSTTRNVQQRRPDQLLGSLKAEISNGNSIYHGLEVEYNHRFQAGFTLSSAFTYSRSIDDNSSPANVLLNGGSLLPVPNQPGVRRGPSDFDQPTTWRTSGVWHIPFGKSFAGVRRQLLADWELSGIFTRDAGLPFSVTSPTGPSVNGEGLDLANVVPGIARMNAISNDTAAITGTPIVNQLAYAVNAAGTIGNSGRNSLYAPGFTNLDSAIAKDFSITERVKFQFRAEFFNTLNHPQFFPPVSSFTGQVANPNLVPFGKLTSARDPRILQFSGKISF